MIIDDRMRITINLDINDSSQVVWEGEENATVVKNVISKRTKITNRIISTPITIISNKTTFFVIS